MSEHLSIESKVDYHHLPYDESGAFTYCNHCKETCDSVSIELHEGWLTDWMVLRCSKCKKSTWTSKIKRKITKDNKECTQCGKPTNWIDCFMHGGRICCNEEDFWCSEKCHNESQKYREEENHLFSELVKCFEEQHFTDDKNYDLIQKIAREESKWALHINKETPKN